MTKSLRSSSRFPSFVRTSLCKAVMSAALLGSTLAALSTLQGCVLLVGGAAVGGGLMLSDRRTSGTQIEDQAIELKSGPKIQEILGDRGHVNVTSYNRIVLITGEVPEPADRMAVEKAIVKLANVAAINNELIVAGTSSLSSRSNDTIITSKVKATFVDAKDLQANAVKVVTERGGVYLMGRVTEREATRATELARSVGGVLKVVRVFEILSEAELSGLQNK